MIATAVIAARAAVRRRAVLFPDALTGDAAPAKTSVLVRIKKSSPRANSTRVGKTKTPECLAARVRPATQPHSISRRVDLSFK